ncbi:FG-GAP-like repeat-containing protein [Streptomyces sp. NPDC039028]|uniref:FG-GAP-like repeat-containing protein n=1 Tax=unclassified Streptomyces TaxID=2593676 RepID=UPI00340BC019
MSQTGSFRRRLTTAVAVALAAGCVSTFTAGGTAAATATTAVSSTTAQQAVASLPPASPAVTAAEQDVDVPFPVDATVVSAGPTGFLSAQSGEQLTWRWTRYADGVATVLPPGSYRGAKQTDIVARTDGSGVYTLSDMAMGGDPLEVDTRPLGEGYTLSGIAGSTLVMRKATPTGGTELHLVGKDQGVLVDQTVTGLPAEILTPLVVVDSPGTVLVRYPHTVDGVKRNRVTVVDVATHAVVEEYEAPDVPVIGMALSGTHIAWVEKPADSTVKVAVVLRGTTQTVRHDMDTTRNVAIQIVGDWLTHRRYSVDAPTTANPSYSLYARPLSGGEPVKLLEHTLSSSAGPGGTQLVRGGTFEHDEGLYQIAPGTAGARPVVTLVASTGEPTTLELVSHTVPTTLDLDRPGAGSLTWNVSRGAYANVELVHKATGKTATATPNVPTLTEGVHTTRWDGLFDDGITAYNGEYTWKLTASPWDRVGPDLVRTGTFKLVRKPTSHDFNDNGSSDLLLRNDLGELLVHDSHMVPSQQGPVWTKTAPVRIGTGWNTYDQVLIAPGNIAGSAYADIVARDKTGVLWLHQGAGRTLVPRVRVGGGWQIYNQITSGGDVSGDGRPDLLAIDKAGVLWLYKGTGSATAPFSKAVRIGGGWGIYNQITATGNIGGGPAGDLVARDKDGVLWLYLGKADGTFAPRTRIGGGWGSFPPTAMGDVDRDGRPDLVAYRNEAVYFAKGTGDWKAPFAPVRKSTYLPTTSYAPTVF